MKKRITSLFLAIITTLSLLPTSVFADSSGTGVGNGDSDHDIVNKAFYTWNDPYLGLRFSVVNNYGELVTLFYDTVDVDASKPTTNWKPQLSNKFNKNTATLAKDHTILTTHAAGKYVAEQIILDNPKLAAHILGLSEEAVDISKAEALANARPFFRYWDLSSLPLLGQGLFLCP